MGIKTPPCLLRNATLADATAIVEVHVGAWKETYKDLAPQVLREKLTVQHRLPGWQKALADPAPDAGTIVAEMGGQIVGFVRFGPASQPELGHQGEVKHLYIIPSAQGVGLGRRLLSAAFEALKKLQFSSATLAVVEGNGPALAFYARQGGERVGSFTDAGPVWRSKNHIFKWSLEDLA